jgi:hypothetical protein
MLNRKSNLLLSLTVSLFCFSYGNAYSKSVEPTDVDKLFKKIDLTKLTGTNHAHNLMAQLSDPAASTDNINDMNDFIALSVNTNNQTIIVEFDKNQNISKKITMPMPWVGVANFHKKEIPDTSLQEGLQAVRSCMSEKGTTLSEQITRVAIYKTLNTQQIVYDYVFKNENLPDGFCQEMLYTPDTRDCEAGMQVTCHYTVTEPKMLINKH